MPSNCKVHFAGSDNTATAICALRANDVRYRLFTAYPFIKDAKSSYKVQEIVENKASFNHVIVDSGLFTLMFGSKSGTQLTFDDMMDWMLRIVRFSEENDVRNASYVECDSQKLVGSEATWEIRTRMRELMGGKEVINVFHLEDGPKGFDRLVEFSDYIAISVPELRIHRPKQYKQMTCQLAKRARMLKPSVKIHLLGCTEKQLLIKNKFVTSADSSSWLSPARYGFFGKHRTNDLTDEFKKAALAEVQKTAQQLSLDIGPIKGQKEKNIATWYLGARQNLANYRSWCGSQK